MNPRLQAAASKPSRARMMIIIGGAALAVLVLMGVCTNALFSSPPSGSRQAQSAPLLDAPATTPLPTAAPAAVLLDLAGSGNSASDPFSAPRAFRVDYTATPAATPCRFQVYLTSGSAPLGSSAYSGALMVDRSIPAEAVGSFPWPAAGFSRIYVMTECVAWHLRITG